MSYFGLTLRPEWKEKWLTALRSGEFIQGTSDLCIVENKGTVSHCCLGVLGEVSGLKRNEDLYLIWPRGPIRDRQMTGTLSGKYFDRFVKFDKATITKEEREELKGQGLDALKITSIDKLQGLLAEMNDDEEENRSFEDIANWIEENL